ncbi:MAG TPA: PAS domain S-box protein [Opitutus sp.]|nr:PAS domain S-box protein [Opitutus sp.]
MLRYARVLAGTAVLAGMADLAAWRFAAPEWIAGIRWYLVGVVPAAAFVVLGAALLLRLALSRSRAALGLLWLAAALVAAAGLHAAIACGTGRPPGWEAWLMAVVARGAGARTTLDAALLLAATACNLVALTLDDGRIRLAREAGVLSAGLVMLLGFLCMVSSAAGNPAFSVSDLLTIPPTTALGFVCLNAALVLSISHIGRWRRLFFGVYEVNDLPPLLRTDRSAFGVLALAAILLLAGTTTYLRVQTGEYRRRVQAELRVTIEQRVEQLAQWRRERLADAQALAGTFELSPMLAAIRRGPMSDAQRAEIVRWLESFARAYGYRCATLVDGALKPVVVGSVGPPSPGEEVPAGLRQLPADRDAFELPPYVDADGTLKFDTVGVIRPAAGGPAIGAVVLQAEPGKLFVKLLDDWPYGKKSAGVGIWQGGKSVLTLIMGHWPQGHPNAPKTNPFGQKRDLSEDALIARSVASPGLLQEGVDFFGIPATGLSYPVPGSSWLIAGRIDSSEIYGPLRRGAWQVVGLVTLLASAAGFMITRVWRRRAHDLQRERIVAELAQKRTAARLGMVMQEAKDVILVLDEHFRITEANEQAFTAYGWSREELLGRPVRDLRAPAAAGDFAPTSEAAVESGEATFETVQQRKDGSTFPVEVSTRQFESEGRRQWLSIVRDITERKRVESELRATEERYRLIAENTSDVIWLMDVPAYVLTYASPSVLPVLGLRPEDVIGRPLGGYATATTTTRAKIQEQVAAFDAGDRSRQTVLHEVELSAADGGARYLEILATVLANDGGRARMLLGITRDITERKRAEAELRASEERYRLIAENTSDVIWLYDLAAQGFSYVSPSVVAQRGYRPEELLGRPLTFSLPDDAARRVADALAAETAATPATGRRNFNLEVDQRHKDGHLVPTEVVASLLRDGTGRPTHLLGITRDITERRRAREALEKFSTELEQQVEERTAELAASQKQLRTLVDNLQSVIYMKDRSGRYLLVNPHYERVTGIVAKTIFGKTDVDVMPAAVAERLMAQDRRVMESGEALIAEETVLNADGTPRHYLSTKVPLFDEQGSVYGICGISSDITSLKQAEIDMAANLERERQLSGMKSQFISVASHEFRTPLAAAVATLELLDRHAAKLTEAKRVELIARIQRSLGRLTTIMNDVLQLSRADSGRVKPVRMNADLVKFAQDILREVESGDGEQHRFVFETTGGPGTVPVDTKLTHHIVSNLVGNAVRYSPAGTTVTVKLHLDAAAFTFLVIDEGIGIPEAEREHVFEPFARGSNVGQISGTGLGLNIVKRYTELMGGTIEVLPVERGTIFKVSIPHSQPTPRT